MQTELPKDSLLGRYAIDASGLPLPHYTDCFQLDLETKATLDDFVRAFYTTPLFRCERFVLALAGLRSKDSDIDGVLAGQQQHFAAWTVEDRKSNQLLMCDVNARTRSWFMVEPANVGTNLYFGSAVTSANGARLPRRYAWLLGLHRLYSRALLNAAVRRLLKKRVV